MKMIEQCPICHKKGFCELLKDFVYGTYSVFCFNCGCETDDHASPDDAIRQWNEGKLIDERI